MSTISNISQTCKCSKFTNSYKSKTQKLFALESYRTELKVNTAVDRMFKNWPIFTYFIAFIHFLGDIHQYLYTYHTYLHTYHTYLHTYIEYLVKYDNILLVNWNYFRKCLFTYCKYKIHVTSAKKIQYNSFTFCFLIPEVETNSKSSNIIIFHQICDVCVQILMYITQKVDESNEIRTNWWFVGSFWPFPQELGFWK